MRVCERAQKKIKIFLSVMMGLLTFALASYADEPAETAKAPLPPVVMGYMDFPPLMWDENGEPKGELIDLAKEIARQQGFELRFVTRPVNRLYQDVVAGKVHVWIGSPFTSSIRGKVLFRDPAVVVAELQLWAKKGTELIPLDSVRDQPLIVRRGYKYGGRYDALAAPERGLKLIAASSHADLFELLKAGRALYALDYKRPAIVGGVRSEDSELFHYRKVEGFPSYFNVSKAAPNAERILEAFHAGLVFARANIDPKTNKMAR